MLIKELKQSYLPFQKSPSNCVHASVFFAAYLPRALMVNVNDGVFGSTLSNNSQKIKPNTVYTLSMMIYSHK